MGIHLRGVTQIKTLAAVRGCGVHSNERHVHHFQVASLELEKARRTRERQAAVKRIKNLDARLAELDALIQKRQQALAIGTTAAACDRPVKSAKQATSEKRRTLRYGN